MERSGNALTRMTFSNQHPPAPQPPAPTDAPAPDIWPAHLWIALGALIYAGAPDLYDPFAAAVYFLAGGAVSLAVIGAATARFNRLIEPILRDMLPTEGDGDGLLTAALRWLAVGMEGLAIMHIARIAIIALAP